MMHRSTRFYISVFAFSMLSSAAVRAQDDADEMGEATYKSSLSFNDHSDAPPLEREAAAGAVATDEESQVLSWINGLSSVGSAAWPTVRAYVWESCFAGSDLFAGYAYSLPGNEDGDVLTFQLLIDRTEWIALAAGVRQAAMHTANELFTARLEELNLQGTLSIVLTSR